MLPGTAHDLQFPEQAVEQHVPCAQNPELQSALPLQVAPTGFFPQLPFMQVAGDAQSLFVVQVVAHCPVGAHMNGAQEVVVAPKQ
jgi:hypothetical protein